MTPSFLQYIIVLFSLVQTIGCKSDSKPLDVLEEVSDDSVTLVEAQKQTKTIADFLTFDMALWGVEKVESNRNYNSFTDDSCYFAVSGKIDSIILFNTNGIERFKMYRVKEASHVISSAYNGDLQLLEGYHSYSNVDTLIQQKFKYTLATNAAIEELNIDSKLVLKELNKYEEEFGQKLWSIPLDDFSDRISTKHCRDIYKMDVLYANGDSTSIKLYLQFIDL